jgi:hypothetical protein
MPQLTVPVPDVLVLQRAKELGWIPKPDIIQPPDPPNPTTNKKNFEPGSRNVQRANVGGLKNLGPMRATLDEASIKSVVALGFKLAKWPLAMPRDRRLPDSFKNGVKASAQMALSQGVKLAIRPQYHQRNNGQLVGFVPDMGLVEAHIPQMGELFAEIRPALAYTEAGYLGEWAEWHSDQLIRLPDGNFNYVNAKRVFDLINQHYPKDLHKLVRYCRPLVRMPSNPLGWFDWNKSVNRDTEGAQAFWGLHNDFYAAGGADASTFFPDRGSAVMSESDKIMHEQQKKYLYESAQFVYYVGEPDRNPGNFWDSGKPQPVSQQGLIAKVKAEGLSALNLDGRANMRQWMQQQPALYQQLLATLGYNLYTEQVEVKTEGKQLTLNINWGNIGSSGVLNPIKLILVGDGFLITLSENIQDTTPTGSTHMMATYKAQLPDLAKGKYKLGLILEDKTGLVAFNTQLNNKGMSFTNGVNDLGMMLEV